MEVLISEVAKRNILWNKRYPPRNGRITKDKEWNYVAKSVGLSKDDAKKKWRNVRDQFFKELKKIPKSKSGDWQNCAAAYPGRWKYFNNLLFLKDAAVLKDTEQNALVESDNSQSATIQAEDDPVIKDESVELNSEVCRSPSIEENTLVSGSQSKTIPYPSSDNSPLCQKRKRVYEENDDIELKLLRADIEAKKIETADDENLLFLRSLLPFLRKMDPLRQLRVRTKFQEVLIQEMQEMENQVL